MRNEPRLVALALAFSELQAARHEADYDHLADFDRSSTLLITDRAREAVGIVEIERDTPAFEAFFALLALTT